MVHADVVQENVDAGVLTRTAVSSIGVGKSIVASLFSLCLGNQGACHFLDVGHFVRRGGVHVVAY